MSVKQPNELVVSTEAVPDATVIWRYFKFERFLDVLETHSLWFSRPFRFDDRWEGLFPPAYVRRTRQFANANGIPFDEFDRDFRRRLLRHRYAHFVSCWHMSDYESDAMWKLYALANTGIAIQSTVGDVNECVRADNSGRVIYYDPFDDVRSATVFGPNDILFKRTSFSWEREYRFWFDDEELRRKIDAGISFGEEELSRGRAVGITNMKRLINKIVVAPGASDEFVERVQSACAERRMQSLGNLVERSSSDRMWESFVGYSA